MKTKITVPDPAWMGMCSEDWEEYCNQRSTWRDIEDSLEGNRNDDDEDFNRESSGEKEDEFDDED